jgi:hypothetical protein
MTYSLKNKKTNFPENGGCVLTIKMSNLINMVIWKIEKKKKVRKWHKVITSYVPIEYISYESWALKVTKDQIYCCDFNLGFLTKVN